MAKCFFGKVDWSVRSGGVESGVFELELNCECFLVEVFDCEIENEMGGLGWGEEREGGLERDS